MTTTPVLHRSARAITISEFRDALRATCPPRFPQAKSLTHRRIGLAVSGGVDSMALAFLCSKIRIGDPYFRISDHPVGCFYAMIIDHGLREGSTKEANDVAEAVEKMGLRGQVMKIHWTEIVGKDRKPNDLPNVETLARQLRYRRIAQFCKMSKVASVLTAHHEDDQYETVLMRLLSGHGYRGLQGMRTATDIPECYDVHGAYQSGIIDDQQLDNPFYNMRPSGRQRKYMRRDLRYEVDPAVLAKEIEEGLDADAIAMYLDDYDAITNKAKRAPPLGPLDVEDGGIMVYRPLLHFSKERLVATCVENGIPWFEDHTNADPTLTTRNAVRHMYKNWTLPAALQKPAILRLAERCRAKVASEEAEADRLLHNVIFHKFENNTGTLVVTLPNFSFPIVPRRSTCSPTGRRKRTEHYRRIAAVTIRKLLSMVTPERELPPVQQLGPLVSMLFPSLVDEGDPPEPKAYVICGVHFIPLVGDFPLRWLLARAPHVSNVPRPFVASHGLALAKRISKHPTTWKPESWAEARLFDGRYWIRISHRLPCTVRVAPFEPEHQKPFREALDDRSKNDLLSMLRKYAPGKIRYTLPAIYSIYDVSNLLAGGNWWPDWQSKAADGSQEQTDEVGTLSENIRTKTLSEVFAGRLEWEKDVRERGKPQLLALPTLGISLPGLDDWLQWDIRYRKVDHRLLQLSKLGDFRLGRRELRFRVRTQYRYRRKRLRKPWKSSASWRPWR